MSRTSDLINQIKQITIELRDIKTRNHVNSSKVSNTVNVHNRTENGPLQVGHEAHDEDDVHYDDSIRNVHQPLHSRYNQERCAPTQYPTPIESTSSPPLPPELHPSPPSNGNPAKPVSSTTPWSRRPNIPESPGNEEDNVGGVVDLLCTTNGTTSGDVNDAVPCAD